MADNIRKQPNRRPQGIALVDVAAAFVHALATFIPFAAVFYFFVPLQSYTHWAFRAYYWLVWLLPLTGLVHLFIRSKTWGDRWRVIGSGFAVSLVVAGVLTLAWGTYTG